MQFDLKLLKKDIQKTREIIIQEAAKTVKVRGFRQGKVPLNIAKQHLDPQKIDDEVVRKLLPTAYQSYIQDHQLKPITNPKITPKSIKPNEDWNFTVEIAQKPAVKLNDYQKAVKKAKPGPKIIKPGDTNVNTNPKQDEEESLLAIYSALLKTAQVDIPALLIEEEVNHSLSHLLEQTQKLGLTIEQYLTSISKTAKQLRQEYALKAENSLKLEFILDAIATDAKIEVTDTELKEFVNKIKDEEVRKQVEKNAYQQALIRNSLQREHVVNHLKSL